MESTGIIPYSPEWWIMRNECFTGSEVWKLMTEPRGKSPFEKYEEHVNNLRKWEAQLKAIENKTLKSAIKLSEKIEKNNALTKQLFEHKNDLHFSDTAETYILEKVHAKLTGIGKNNVDNFATQWGVEHEPMAKKWYAKITGHTLIDPLMQLHEEIEGFSCTPDSLTDPDLLQEFKCPANGANHLKHWLISSVEYMKEKHDDYYWQCVSQMNILKRPKNDFVSFDPRIDNDKAFFIFRLEYDENEGKLLEERVKASRILFNDYYNLFAR